MGGREGAPGEVAVLQNKVCAVVCVYLCASSTTPRTSTLSCWKNYNVIAGFISHFYTFVACTVTVGWGGSGNHQRRKVISVGSSAGRSLRPFGKSGGGQEARASQGLRPRQRPCMEGGGRPQGPESSHMTWRLRIQTNKGRAKSRARLWAFRCWAFRCWVRPHIVY